MINHWPSGDCFMHAMQDIKVCGSLRPCGFRKDVVSSSEAGPEQYRGGTLLKKPVPC